MAEKIIEFEKGWLKMEKGLDKLKRILDGDDLQFEAEEYMDLYTQIYNMCTQKPPHHQALYDKYAGVFQNYLADKVRLCIKEKQQQSGPEAALPELMKTWSNHKIMVRWLGHFFDYLQRYFIPRSSLPTLPEVALDLFHRLVYDEIKHHARNTVIGLIDRERQGEQIDRSLLKDVRDLFVAMGGVNSKTQNGESSGGDSSKTQKVEDDYLKYYQNDLEAHILEDAAAFYGRQASTWILEDSCPEYMIKAENSLNQEKDRAMNYLHDSTKLKLLEKVRHELLIAHADQLLEKEHTGCRVLLRDNMVDDLSRMYKLFSQVEKGGLEPVSKIFKEHVTSEGIELVNQSEDAAVTGAKENVFMPKVFELHDKYMAHVTNCFKNQTLFHKALKEAFEVFCNKKIVGSTSAEVLAAFVDSILQKSGGDDDAVEQTLEKIVQILAYISDKDMFSEFCRKKLARRLLFDRSANPDHERSFLAKLKQHYGSQFMSKMEGMLNDLILSKDNQVKFEEHLTNNPKANPGTSLSVTVLTTGMWPTYKPSELNLPDEMLKCVASFKEFYESSTRSRKLTWIPSLGSCTLTGKFDNKNIELVVSTYQAAALLLFNDSDRLSYSDIVSQLNLNDDDVVRVLHSLSCAKYKILKKLPNTKSISPSDYFEYNSEFTDRMRRIRVPLPPSDDKKKVAEDVNKDRKYAIDACIVRIMKSRKVLGYQQLMLECIEQLSRMFKPDVKMIKPRIEDLISREFLERDADNPSVLKYLA